ncbi:MAG TPA: hypothetical protein VFX16_15320 [Pseudonocardiaceae bacterium]|nr:hypothetical protein [Pseudonocardiaceae bacterium]
MKSIEELTSREEPEPVAEPESPHIATAGRELWIHVVALALRIWRLRSRLEFLRTAVRAIARSEVMSLIIVPILTFVFVYVVASISGVGYIPHCNSVSNFAASLLFQPIRPSTCHAVPFLSDIPTVILSFTCPFALVGFQLLRRRLTGIIADLIGTGLIQSESSSTRIVGLVRSLKRTVNPALWLRIVLFLSSLLLVTWLYWRNLVDGHLFDILASGPPDGPNSADGLRLTWWANYHFHPVLAVICILLGTIGVTYAFRCGFLYYKLGLALLTTHKMSIRNLSVQYIPRWRDRSYGWSPVTGALMLIYVSTINLAMSMVSVFDMLQNTTSTFVVAVTFAVIGLASNMLIIGTALYQMASVHQSVRKRLRTRLLRGETTGWRPMSPAEYVVAANELSSWRKLPVGTFLGGIVRILPGLYALFQFVRTFVD